MQTQAGEIKALVKHENYFDVILRLKNEHQICIIKYKYININFTIVLQI